MMNERTIMEEYRLDFTLRIILGEMKKEAKTLAALIEAMQHKGTFTPVEAQVLNIIATNIANKKDGFMCHDLSISKGILKIDTDSTEDDY